MTTVSSTCKARRTNFRGLVNHNGNFSYANAVLQALATAIDPVRLRERLGSDYIGPSVIDQSMIPARMALEVQIAIAFGQQSPVAEMLSLVGLLQEGNNAQPVNGYGLQLMLRVDPPHDCDPVRWLLGLLDQFSIPHPRAGVPLNQGPQNNLIASLFLSTAHLEMVCKGPQCDKDKSVTEIEKSWALRFEVPLRADSPHTTRTVKDLWARLLEKDEAVHDFNCTDDGPNNEAEKRIVDYPRLPHILTIEFEYQGAPRPLNAPINLSTHVRLVLEDSFQTPTPDQTVGNFTYKLQSIIKEEYGANNNHHYRTFSRGFDGDWRRCDGPIISQVTPAQARSTDAAHGGPVRCAIYELQGPVAGFVNGGNSH